jgi:sodium/potassium-transporting ATPase subunit alpha
MAHDKERRKSLALVRTQTMERAQGHAAPIQFRTLSIHVTDTHRSVKDGGMPAYGKERELKPTRFWKGKRKEDDLVAETDFFSAVDFHKLPESEINLRFNSDPTTGLTQQEAGRRLKANGLNTLDSPKPNYLKMILGYTFGGFCSILWLGVITFLICSQPPLSPTPNVTNLALAFLVVSLNATSLIL